MDETMMSRGRTPTAGAYVVWLDEADGKLPATEPGFRFEPVRGYPGAVIARADPAGSPADHLQRLRAIFGPDARVLRLLVDHDGRELVPTGRIEAVFRGSTEPQEIARWADDRKLTIVRASKWRPSVTLDAGPNEVGDVQSTVEELAAEGDLAAVEAETLSAFRRE